LLFNLKIEPKTIPEGVKFKIFWGLGAWYKGWGMPTDH